MDCAIASPETHARRTAHTASTIAVIAAILLGAAALGDVAAAALRAFGAPGPGWEGAAALIGAIGAAWLLALPTFILAGVCLDLRRVMLEYAGGRFFTTRAGAGVRKAGEGLLCAMAFKCLLSPWLYALVIDGVRSDPPALRLESFDLGLIALGFFIMVMGRVLDAAAAIKAENDQII